MHALAPTTPPRRNFRTDHPADAIPSRKRNNDTISPCRAQGLKTNKNMLKNGSVSHFSSFRGMTGFCICGTSAEGMSPSATSIFSSFGLILTSRQSPSSPTPKRPGQRGEERVVELEALEVLLPDRELDVGGNLRISRKRAATRNEITMRTKSR